MADKRLLTGTVLDRDTKERYENATLRFQKKYAKGDPDLNPGFFNTDDDGDFEYDISDETLFPPGDYLLTAFHPLAEMDGSPIPIKLESGKAPGHQEIEMIKKREISMTAGYGFFIGLFILLAGVGYLYFYLHNNVIDNQLDENLPPLISLAKIQASDPDTINANSAIIGTIATMDSIANRSLLASGKAKGQYGMLISEFLDQANTAALANKKGQLTELLKKLDETFEKQTGSFFWSAYPNLLLEVFFWALIASLLRLLVNTGYYVSRKSFYGNSIIHKVSLILTIPILAILISFLLSFVNFSLSLGELQLKLDMSDPIVSILIATLIGLAPWESWAFMNSVADTLFERIGSAFGKSKPA